MKHKSEGITTIIMGHTQCDMQLAFSCVLAYLLSPLLVNIGLRGTAMRLGI
ncbi:hypothetical protein BIFGAL_03043 [Bifidobacterium gallicum DSM 20093 = LMG 11596]|uniref:Uncharacterized protein n=1 Tax=Bifidobacterium gallicum DSM 20093 = LMG 11596 TaxID=561180 RepID=D1NRU4_9BIFI|nr:hypothetical protein BIFGAL_03043 [Bifidobacterium gallicum DSM 20093 = LMG 11596]